MLSPRIVVSFVALPLLACGESAVTFDGQVGTGGDAGSIADATPIVSDAATPMFDATSPPECTVLEVWDGQACIDRDECAEDNGGCGDPTSYLCENQDRAPPVCTYDPAADFAALTDGVAIIDSGGALPSSLVVHGRTAFGVVFDESERAFIAAARAGMGRLVVFGHEAHLGGLLDNESDIDQLAANAITWTTQTEAPVVGGDRWLWRFPPLRP